MSSTSEILYHLWNLYKMLPKVGTDCYPHFCFFQLSLFLLGVKHFISLSICLLSSSDTLATLAEVSYPSSGYSLELSNKSHRSALYTCYWIAAQSQISHLLQVLFPSVKIRILIAAHCWKTLWDVNMNVKMGSNSSISNCMDLGTTN